MVSQIIIIILYVSVISGLFFFFCAVFWVLQWHIDENSRTVNTGKLSTSTLQVIEMKLELLCRINESLDRRQSSMHSPKNEFPDHGLEIQISHFLVLHIAPR